MMRPQGISTAKEPATTRKVLSAQKISRMCLVCGVQNRFGLQARFYEVEGEPDGGAAVAAGGGAGPRRELLGIFTPLPEHQSYPGRLHGGIASAILDETIGRAIMIARPDTWGVTAELTVRYRKPVPLAGEIRALARITRDTRRLFEGSGEIILADGTVAVEATGKYLKLPLEDIAGDEMGEAEWFADSRTLPESVDLEDGSDLPPTSP
jgi:acyl-coenzyme A thioesterase PaaI-like protein